MQPHLLEIITIAAQARLNPNPFELSTDEGKRLIDAVAQKEEPLFVLTGGGPIKRPDLFEVIEDATSV